MDSLRIIGRLSFLCTLITIVLAIVSCSSPSKSADSQDLQQDPKLKQGQVLFLNNCNKCHPDGQAGIGPSLRNKALPAIAIRIQVRNGFGGMPAFKKDRLSDAQVDQIIAYVQYMHKEAKK